MTNDTKHPAPTKPGWYWAKWRTSTCDGEWEPVIVFAGALGEMIGNVWGVGHKHVSLPNFTWGPRIPGPDELAAMQAELSRLREAARWRKWPGEMPDKEDTYEVWGYYDQPDKPCADMRYYWHNHGFPHAMTVTHWRPIVGPGEESK